MSPVTRHHYGTAKVVHAPIAQLAVINALGQPAAA
jgi:hypothetical protein